MHRGSTETSINLKISLMVQNKSIKQKVIRPHERRLINTVM